MLPDAPQDFLFKRISEDMDTSADALSNPQVAGASVREVLVTIPLRRLPDHPVSAIGASGNAR